MTFESNNVDINNLFNCLVSEIRNNCLVCENMLKNDPNICDSCSILEFENPENNKNNFVKSDKIFSFVNYFPDGSGDSEIKEFVVNDEIYEKFSECLSKNIIFSIEILTTGEVCLSISDETIGEDIHIDLFDDYSEIYHKLEENCMNFDISKIDELRLENDDDEFLLDISNFFKSELPLPLPTNTKAKNGL